MLKIRNQTTGESIALVRDVCHRHPEWVHEQCGTKSESELQGMWDCMQERDYYGNAEDECGIYWEGDHE